MPNSDVLTVSCVLRGHECRNEVQVVAQVFFPGARFSFGEDICANGFCVESFFDGGAAWAVIYKNGAEITREKFADGGESFLNSRRILMLAIYHALQRAVGAHTPWGALTGIRPSKLVREWMGDGCGDDDILARLANPFCVSDEKARLAVATAHAEQRVEARISGSVGLYISVPFCPSRCIYCSFNTADKPADADFLARYVSAIIDEIREKVIYLRESGLRISSIYIGGGTPTFLPNALLEKMLFAARENFAEFLMLDAEFTVEAGRPDTLTPTNLQILRRYGVNRIAVNPQTLNDAALAAIGRSHTAADFFRAFALARDAGFDCINTDLIAGLPGETDGDMRRNMDALAPLAPENITIHTLAIKRASHLKARQACIGRRGHLVVGDITSRSRIAFDACEQIGAKNFGKNSVEAALSVAAESCAAMGLSPYYLYRQKNMVGLFENVGYALPGRECLYNVGMMAEVQTILGIGAGAVSKFVRGAKISREFNAKNPEVFVARRAFAPQK
ncbi:MAG: coproporphyrinogen dehydrogenase HemZ [Defluviitaleaceae bacterium]|nr:coproporphyrinogen dehydrogenase HemZ [Defluviitaleaceae bacterium]